MNTPIGKGTQTSVCPHAGKPAGVGVQAWGTVHPPASPFFFFFFLNVFALPPFLFPIFYSFLSFGSQRKMINGFLFSTERISEQH